MKENSLLRWGLIGGIAYLIFSDKITRAQSGFSFVSARIKKVTPSAFGLGLTIDITLNNTSGVAVYLDQVHGNLVYGGKILGTMSFYGPMNTPKTGDFVLPITGTIPTGAFTDTLYQAISKGDYSRSLVFEGFAQWGAVKVPVTYKIW